MKTVLTEEVPRLKIAFLDFDNTLARGDSIVSFLRWSVRKGKASPLQWLRAAAGYLAYKWHRSVPANAASKEKSLSFVKGWTEAAMDAAASSYWQTNLLHRCYVEGIQELEKLRRAGYRTVIVSASMSGYMDLLPRMLPADEVLCTRAEIRDGRYTGHFGPNCKGEEKVRRIRAWAESQKIRLADAEILAYGDSASDLPMLHLSPDPVLINPCKKVRQALPDARCLCWHRTVRS